MRQKIHKNGENKNLHNLDLYDLQYMKVQKNTLSIISTKLGIICKLILMTNILKIQWLPMMILYNTKHLKEMSILQFLNSYNCEPHLYNIYTI